MGWRSTQRQFTAELQRHTARARWWREYCSARSPARLSVRGAWGGVGGADAVEALGGGTEVAAGAAAALGCGVAELRCDQSFFGVALERGVDAAKGGFAPGGPLDFGGDGDPVAPQIYRLPPRLRASAVKRFPSVLSLFSVARPESRRPGPSGSWASFRLLRIILVSRRSRRTILPPTPHLLVVAPGRDRPHRPNALGAYPARRPVSPDVPDAAVPGHHNYRTQYIAATVVAQAPR